MRRVRSTIGSRRQDLAERVVTTGDRSGDVASAELPQATTSGSRIRRPRGIKAKEGLMIPALKELLEAWVKYRALWIEKYGSDAGFAEWYGAQVVGTKALLTKARQLRG
jgi:hypothetical protein